MEIKVTLLYSRRQSTNPLVVGESPKLSYDTALAKYLRQRSLEVGQIWAVSWLEVDWKLFDSGMEVGCKQLIVGWKRSAGSGPEVGRK